MKSPEANSLLDDCTNETSRVRSRTTDISWKPAVAYQEEVVVSINLLDLLSPTYLITMYTANELFF